MPDWKPEIRRRLANLKLEPTREAAMVEEFAQHLEDCYAESRALGASEEEASRAALAELSERHRLAEELRRVERQVKSEPVVLGARRGNMLGEINQDLRYGARILRRSPGFTAVAVLSLALGIGANTAIFTLVDAVLLKLLPVRNPQELIIVAHSGKNAPSTSSNYPMYELFRDHNRSLAGLTAFWPMDLKVQADAETRTVAGQFVTGNYFALLGVPAAAGRTITAGDEAAPDVAVISHGFWRRHFGADPGVVGRTLVVNRTPLTIVGVTAPDFWGLEAGSPVDVSVPLTLQPRILSEYGNRLTERGGWWGLCLVGRLKPGVTAEPARADLDLLLRQWLAAEKVPEQTINKDFARAELLPGSRGLDALRRRFSQPLLVLAAVVAAVLLVACANIANLLLARAAARRKEVAVRLALGASRGRLIRQLLTESCLLAASGGALGLLFGWWGSGLLVAFIASGPGRVALEVRPDPRVLAFTAGVSLLTGIVVGLAPAFRSTRVDLTPALKAGATGSGISHPRGSAGRTLVAAQLALSLVLVIGATLFASSLRNLTAVDVGMRVENLLLVTFDSIGTGYDRGRRVAFYRAALERVQGLPGVSAAAMSSLSPLSGDDSTRFLDVPGFAARTPDDHVIHLNYISAGYFETMGIPVSRGREFAPQDAAGARRVVALNETAARFYFAGADPVGKVVRVGRGADSPPLEIVGVVKDSKRQDPREAPERVVYLPALQYAQPFMTLEIRTALDPTAVAAGVRQALSEVNRDIPVREIRTARAQLEGLLVQERLLATLSGFFGALALLLAALGLSGTLSQLVARRTGEIGIRIALGAQRGDVLRLVLGEAARAVLIGVAVGLLAAWAAGRLVTGLLFGLTAMNPVAHLISIAGLLATAAVAAYLPARRATRVDPMVALRDE